jgi:murein DD-endopeptidase MepM/ murein hydrolase activator NlpD
VPARELQERGGHLVRADAGWPTVFELDPGQQVTVTRSRASGLITRTVTLLSFKEIHQPDFWVETNLSRRTFARAEVVVDVSGERAVLRLRPYEFPRVINGLRLYVEMTRNWATDCDFDRMSGMKRAIRLSATAADEGWGPPMSFPLRDYRWRLSTYYNSWSALVPYNSKRYYHRGEDLGVLPQQHQAVATLAGTVAKLPPPGGNGSANTVSIAEPSGTLIRYLHMNSESISAALVVGGAVDREQPVGRSGDYWHKAGGLDDDPHLHFAFEYGETELSPYPAVVEAYFRSYPDSAMPVSGGNYYALVGEPVELDGTRTQVRTGRAIKAMSWTLHDGRTLEGPVTAVRFDRPGLYVEELTVETDDGFVDKDFAYVRVYEPVVDRKLAYGHVYYAPARGIRVGTPVRFWNYLHNSDAAEIDFGDGSAMARTEARRGDVTHAYSRSGLYVVTVRAVNPASGGPTALKMRVHVEP